MLCHRCMIKADEYRRPRSIPHNINASLTDHMNNQMVPSSLSFLTDDESTDKTTDNLMIFALERLKVKKY